MEWNGAVRRISVVGNSGSGKTRLAGALAERLGAPHLELDSIFHQPAWEPRPLDGFRAEVHEFCAGDAWVVDGNYRAVQDLVWARADTVVWLDLPRRVVMRQIIGRSVGRATLRRELWNGNRESVRNLFARDPQKSMIRWAWTRHDENRARCDAASCDPAHAHLQFIRLPSHRAAEELLTRVVP
jgi:adenylate kinase family enzyme